MNTRNNLLQKIVGTDNASSSRDICSAYSYDGSFRLGEEPSWVVRPRNTEEVQNIVRLANSEGFALVPVSSGGPRFRGDTIPEQQGSVVVDMSAMKAIVRVDRKTKTAIVEPGVTFNELIDAADAKGLRVAAPLMPRRTKSVVGSLLEREPTTLPKYHWDMQDPLCCVEVVFGSGDQFRTGSAAGPGSIEAQWASGQAQKSPMGPAQTDWAKIIQGSQGTMGIVTWASVKLEIKPQIEKAFLVGAPSLEDLTDFAYALTGTRYADHCFILNRTDCAAIMNGLPDSAVPEWILFYTIAGLDHFPGERIAYIEKDISDIAGRLKVEPLPNIGSLDAEELLRLIVRPSTDPYWKLRKAGGFQDLLFLCTLDRSPDFIKALHHEMKNAGIPADRLGVYLQPIQQGRVCHYECTLMFNNNDKDEIKKTQAFCEFMTGRIMEMGGFFSRPYGSAARAVYEKCPDTVKALIKVKNILDPRGVMNPGKLCFMKK